MSNLGKWLGAMKVQFDKHSPAILTGLGIAGMGASLIFAVKATPKAKECIEKKKQELKKEKLNVREAVGATWKHYIPSAITFVASTGCLIGYERPGAHNWEFWDAHITEVLDFFVSGRLPDDGAPLS